MVGRSGKYSEIQEVSQGGGFDDCRFDGFRCGDLINRKSPNRPIATSSNPSSPSSPHQAFEQGTEEQNQDKHLISDH